MFNYLSKNHDVDVYTSDGVNILIDASYEIKKHYDLAIINHNTCLHDLESWNIKKRIFTSHGVLPDLEKAIPGADKYIAVSEEVQTAIIKAGFHASIIRNPIDTDFFTPSSINKRLKNILYLNNNAMESPHTRKIIKACSGNYDFRILAGHKDDVKKHISWSDLVITLGRGCYESLSCGKNVIVAGEKLDGIVTPESIFELRKNNCSGRRFNREWTTEDLKQELKKYDSDRNMRGYILENNNINFAAEEYLRS